MEDDENIASALQQLWVQIPSVTALLGRGNNDRIPPKECRFAAFMSYGYHARADIGGIHNLWGEKSW